MSEETKDIPMGFGITAETKDSNNVKMLAPIKVEASKTFPNGYKFPVGRLVNVVAKKDYETKNGKTDVIQFIFKDKEGRQHIRTEWAQDTTDEKYSKKVDAMNSRVKHMYTQLYAEFPEKGIGVNAKSWFGYFEAMEAAFKSNKEYHKIPLFLKLVYFNGNLDFPYSPNFLQRAGEGVICKLEINLKYDTIDQSSGGGAGVPNLPGGGAGGDDIDFDNEYS
tara:strand:- start:39783 stop:40445 length:663 start_codon:yes stop_codon:yes gene_type:complete